jgi:hypothetical protein
MQFNTINATPAALSAAMARPIDVASLLGCANNGAIREWSFKPVALRLLEFNVRSR